MTSPAAPRWYVVHTQPHGESRALANLLRQDFAAYLPRYRGRRRHAGRVDDVSKPLFPRYLFVAMDIAQQRWRAIQSTFGVSHLVCRGDEPAAVPDGVVEAIRAREDDKGWIRLGTAASLAAGAAVRVLDGAFADRLGLFEAMTDDARVTVLLDLLGRRVRVALPAGSVVAA
ncbi:MAG: transcriptional activator RfaH [Alphaproteobacteria bacterium]|nr:transcriptional activator RfaH [Alphaproteobacteria bacterium]